MRPIIFILLFTAHWTTWAQIDNFHKDILEMMTLRGDEVNFSLAYHDVFPKLKRNFAKRNVDPSVWEDLQKDEARAVAELLEQSAYAYRQFLSQSEINELIQFYSGSAGQNYAMDGDLSTEEQKEVKRFFKSPTGMKYRKKSDSIAMILDQIKSDWSSALFKQKMRELIKGGYLNN